MDNDGNRRFPRPCGATGKHGAIIMRDSPFIYRRAPARMMIARLRVPIEAAASMGKGGAIERLQAFAALTQTAKAQPARFATTLTWQSATPVLFPVPRPLERKSKGGTRRFPLWPKGGILKGTVSEQVPLSGFFPRFLWRQRNRAVVGTLRLLPGKEIKGGSCGLPRPPSRGSSQ